ncbi:class I tRNA ligase family protein, partial [bacterium]|nr:class I tRNA ligase family protein [bacterium]
MRDYKNPLNLPSNGLAMKAKLAQREPERLKKWQASKLYQQIRQRRAGAEQFILHDGPPYANGDIHIGHSVNKILKDIIVKSKGFQGLDAPYVPGWDCHGLPIEHQVEKKVGRAGAKISVADFRKKCREYAQKQVDKQRDDFIRLGVFADWDDPYLTMDYLFEADIVRALGKIIENGHLVKGFKPVYWSVVGGSALAEAEVEYQDKTSTAIDVKFTAVDQARFASIFSLDTTVGDASVLIWTTTPWTLPANQAVSMHAAVEYSAVSVDGEVWVMASELVDAAMSRYGIEAYQVLGRCRGEALQGLELQHPFYDKSVPIILGDHVTTDAGTGAVHTAPDHGVDDFNVGRRYNIGTLNLVDDYGVYREATPLFAGEHVYKADGRIAELLSGRNKRVRSVDFQHSLPHCWRTETPLIFRATPQGF